MTLADRTEANGGIIRAPQRGPWRVALDLWRAGGSFRGFLEFALIGAVVLAFLPGHGSSGAASYLRSLMQSQNSQSGWPTSTPSASPNAAKIAAPGTAVELPTFNDRKDAIAPRIGDLKIGAAYFDDIEEPLHGHLLAALAAYHARDARGVERALLTDDPEDRRVLMLRGLALLSLPGPESMAAGIGMLDRAAGKGELRAAAILGVLKLTGIAGYARDTEGGRELLERAANAGDAPAARVLGEGFVTGWSGAIDPGRAERYLRLASDRGDGQATFRFGEMLYSGHGVPKNQAEAERLFLKAAKTGHAQAQTMLGVLRLMPYSAGLTDNPDEALGWFERAAAQNEPHAMFYLGIFYIEYGKRAGRIDPLRGAEYFRRCAEISLDGQCLFAYATALDLGVGIPRDPIKAYALYSLAAMHDNKPKAAKRRDELGKDLSPQDLVRANVIASQFLQKKPVSVRVTSQFKAVGTQLNNKTGAPAEAKLKAEP